MNDSENQLYLTPEGEAKCRTELEELRGPRRLELAKRLRFAIQQGDLSENADYTAAKEEQGFLEGRIQELEGILRNSIIIEGAGATDEVGIGNTVVVSENGQAPETFHLVGIRENDPRNRKISYQSPIGKALLGKRVGEIVIAETPRGLIELTILDIS